MGVPYIHCKVPQHDVGVQVNSGLMGPEDFVRVTSTAAAQIFNVYPRKGAVAVGSDADVIVFDPNLEHTISAATHQSKMDTNVYEGKRITGKVCVCSLGSCFDSIQLVDTSVHLSPQQLCPLFSTTTI